jgi:hypothetical protein
MVPPLSPLSLPYRCPLCHFLLLSKLDLYNTLGVFYQLSSGFELKHDKLSGDEDVKIQSMEMSPNLRLDNSPLLTCRPFPNFCLSNLEGASFMCLTSLSIYMNP